MASQIHVQHTKFMQQEVQLNCQLKSRSSLTRVELRRVERGVKSLVDRSSRSATVLDRLCSSTRSILTSIANTPQMHYQYHLP